MSPNQTRRLVKATLFAVCVSYLIACPFSKVEESFNMQATRDLFTYGLRPALATTGWFDGERSRGNTTTAAASAASASDTALASLPYDHLQYPGVVPRTFMGPIIITGLCQTVRYLLFPLIDLARFPLLTQFVARFILLTITLLQWFGVAEALDQFTRNPLTGNYLLLITATQFHLPFYASRMLPNTFACIFTLRSLMHWLKCRAAVSVNAPTVDAAASTTATDSRTIGIDRMRRDFESMAAAVDLVVATALFRCDCLLLLFTVGLTWLMTRQLTVIRAIQYGVAAGVVTLLLSVPLDSVLWQRFTWPEGEVLFFNTILNKSSDWGVSAWHWYWTSALPKALLGSMLFLPIAVLRLPELWTVWEQRQRQRSNQSKHQRSSTGEGVATTIKFPLMDATWLPFVIPALGFVILYSFLGHKEVRFLFPVLPLFNVVAAAGVCRLHTSAFPVHAKDKVETGALLSRLTFIGALLLLVLSALASVTFVVVSCWNYPGGDALQILSRHVQTLSLSNTIIPPSVVVHIDVASAMSGVNLFGQDAAQARTHPHVQWTFVKAGYEAEHLVDVSTLDWSSFTHLLMETDELARNPPAQFRVIGVARGNPRVDLRRGRIATSDAIFVLERRDWLTRHQTVK